MISKSGFITVLVITIMFVLIITRQMSSKMYVDDVSVRHLQSGLDPFFRTNGMTSSDVKINGRKLHKTAKMISTGDTNISTGAISEAHSRSPIYVEGGGGLGNQLFKVASLYGIAKISKRPAVLAESFLTLKNIFPGIANAINITKIPYGRPHTMIGEHGFGIYSPNITHNLPNKTVILSGYYQSYKYFEKFTKETRNIFAFSNDMISDVQLELQKIHREYFARLTEKFDNKVNLTYIGIHVRRGDMVRKKKSPYKTADVYYIRRAMAYFRCRYDHVVFVIRSDSPEWCRAHIRGSNVWVPDQPKRSEVDLCMLSQCNHTIITVGTFGWWVQAWQTTNPGPNLYASERGPI